MNESSSHILDRQAEQLHLHLKTEARYDTKALPRPFFIEFRGTPTSGKSTTIKQLNNFLKRSGFKVLMPQEGAEVIPHTLRDSPEYNIRTGEYALEILRRLRHGHEYDFVLFDRCIFDAYMWMIYWHEKGKLTREEMNMYQSFFLSRFWVDAIDAVYCLICEPEEAMRRENEIAPSEKIGNWTNPETIKKLIAHNRQAHDELVGRFPETLRLFDTTHMNRKDMVLTIAEDLFKTLLSKIKQ